MINAGLAAGAALAALPVILHLFMRQTPKHIIFPALRLVRERQKRSRKRMRIKNWLLLLARMAVLALMALALARPRLYSQMPLGDESVPTALGLVFDTSLSMGYKENNTTRLEEAKERRGPCSTRSPIPAWSSWSTRPIRVPPVGLSPAAARQVDRQPDHSRREPAAEPGVGQVYPAVAECDRPRHEVFVLTDLARSSWIPERARRRARRGRKGQDPEERQDRDVHPSSGRGGGHRRGDPLGPARRDRGHPGGTAGDSRAGAIAGLPTGQPRRRVLSRRREEGGEARRLPAGGQVEVSFMTPPRLQEGEIHRGRAPAQRRSRPAGVQRPPLFHVQGAPGPQGPAHLRPELDADYVAAALDPDPSPSAPRTYEIKRVRPAEFVAQYRDTLKNFSSVFLLNVAALDEESWGLLNGYVHEGGGLVVGLGDRCQAANYNGPTASQVLAAALDQVRPPGAETRFGKVADATHPLFQRYAKEIEPLLAQVPVYRYWSVKPSEAADARSF